MPGKITSINSPDAGAVVSPAPAIRPAREGDLPVILSILEAWPTHFVQAAKPLVERDFAQQRTIVCEMQLAVVGFMIWQANEREIEFLWHAVHPNWNRKGIGSTLVRAVMATATTQARLSLRTATTDSVIAGTQFDGKVYEATNRYFKRFGFADEKVERNYWGESNHCLIMSRPLNPLNPLLARLAPLVRPLQKEIGKSFDIRDAYVGMAFRHDTQSAIFFAEFVPSAEPTAPTGKAIEYVRDEYVLPRNMKFVQLVLDSTELAVTYDVVNPGNTEVDGDMRTRWGQDVSQVFLFRIPLKADTCQANSDAVIYFVGKNTFGGDVKTALTKAASAISQVLRTALFLGHAVPHSADERRLRELAEDLAKKLPRLKEYEPQFQRVLADLANPTAWFTHRYAHSEKPEVKPADENSKFSDDEKTLLEAVRNAKEIIVTGTPEGSFQGKTMRFVTIKPHDPGGVEHAASYKAVVKEADREKAQKEQAGYQLAQFYFEQISFALPPAAILWPVPDDDPDAPPRFTAVIPRVSGQTLTRYIREGWHSFQAATESTGDHFGRIYRSLVAFTRGLGQSVAETRDAVAHQCIYDSHLGDSSKAKGRMAKTKEALRFYLDAHRNAPILRFPLPTGAAEITNPLWFLEQASRNGAGAGDFWHSTKAVSLARVDFCHGDFHSGNMLVRENGTVIVLDYDYVGRDWQFSDIATLEASFLLSLSSSDAFKAQSEWLVVFPALLSALAGQDALGPVPSEILRNADAFNAWRVLQTGRVWVAKAEAFPAYRALLVSALLRLFASNHGLEQDRRRYNPSVFSTAVFYLGSLLNKVVRPPAGQAGQAPEVNLYTAPFDLAGSSLDFSHRYCQQYFKWLTELAKEKDASGKSSLRDEHLKEFVTFAEPKNAGDKASMFRFGLRVMRFAGLQDNELASEFRKRLAEIYSAQSEGVADEIESLSNSWATRYSPESKGHRGDTEILKSAKTLGVKQGGEVQPESKSIGEWQICGLSHAGKFNKDGTVLSENDDAFAVIESSGGSFLAAVADGTGDSEDGARTARTALAAIATKWKESGGVGVAAIAAARAVQEDNRVACLDGACTLAALTLSAGLVRVVQLGDARYFLVMGDGTEKSEAVDKSSRMVIGGEPLGDIITSGGNLVREVNTPTEIQVSESAQPTRFVLASDGAFFRPKQSEDVRELREILDKHSDSQSAAKAILHRALDAFRLGEAKRDNVTVIVGYRSPSPSASPSGK